MRSLPPVSKSKSNVVKIQRGLFHLCDADCPACLLQYYPLKEVLAAEYLLEDFRPDLIEMVLDKLRPEYVRLVLEPQQRLRHGAGTQTSRREHVGTGLLQNVPSWRSVFLHHDPASCPSPNGVWGFFLCY